MTRLLDGMNPEQREVIEAPAVPVIVAATAGSGKTRALVHRIARFVELGADPSRVLAVTFSVKAAKEMNERLFKLGCESARVGTFHSVALQIVREDVPQVGGWRVDDTDRYRICVKDAVGYRFMDWKQADVTYLLSFIGHCKASGAYATPDDITAHEIASRLAKRFKGPSTVPKMCVDAYVMAEQIRRERQLLTFDDMLFEAWNVLRTDEGARLRWSGNWDHVLQDECQDENTLQHELGSLLARDHRSYTVVGDPAQSIYSFRGAQPQFMLGFAKEWDALVIRMGRNYRCGSSIVDIGNRVLGMMPEGTHLGVVMIAERQAAGSVAVTPYEDFDAEGEGVTEKLLESHEDGKPWSGHVVLYRTNAQSRGVEEALLGARVPYVVLGGANFYERREVRDLLAYLRVACGKCAFEDVKRSINTPFRFLGKAFIEGLEEHLSGEGGSSYVELIRGYAESARMQSRQQQSVNQYWGLMRRVQLIIAAGLEATSPTRETQAELAAKPSAILEGLVMDLRYNEWLTRDEGSESPENNRVSNVRELIRAASRFPTVGELLEYIDNTIAQAAKAKQNAAKGDVVTLCSIHRAKGLEWGTVFVLGCNDKILPHAKAEDLGEERRLFYVACTRTVDALHLSYVAQAAVSARLVALQPSMFLREVGLVAS